MGEAKKNVAFIGVPRVDEGLDSIENALKSRYEQFSVEVRSFDGTEEGIVSAARFLVNIITNNGKRTQDASNGVVYLGTEFSEPAQRRRASNFSRVRAEVQDLRESYLHDKSIDDILEWLKNGSWPEQDFLSFLDDDPDEELLIDNPNLHDESIVREDEPPLPDYSSAAKVTHPIQSYDVQESQADFIGSSQERDDEPPLPGYKKGIQSETFGNKTPKGWQSEVSEEDDSFALEEVEKSAGIEVTPDSYSSPLPSVAEPSYPNQNDRLTDPSYRANPQREVFSNQQNVEGDVTDSPRSTAKTSPLSLRDALRVAPESASPVVASQPDEFYRNSEVPSLPQHPPVSYQTSSHTQASSDQTEAYASQSQYAQFQKSSIQENGSQLQDSPTFMSNLSYEQQRAQLTSRSAFNEYGVLSNQHRSVPGQGSIYQITGSHGGAGKSTWTFICAQTAAVAQGMAARKGKQHKPVFLVEADFRNSKLAQRMNIPMGQDLGVYAQWLDERLKHQNHMEPNEHMDMLKRGIWQDPKTGLYIMACPYEITQNTSTTMNQSIRAAVKFAQSQGGLVFVDAATLSAHDSLDRALCQMSSYVILVSDVGHHEDIQRSMQALITSRDNNGIGINPQKITIFMNRTSSKGYETARSGIGSHYNVSGYLSRIEELEPGDDGSVAWVGSAPDHVIQGLMIPAASFLRERSSIPEFDEIIGTRYTNKPQGTILSRLLRRR